MPEFKGTTKEFHRYIGPRIKNLVNAVTRGYRKDLGKCEGDNCYSTDKLEAAHLHGKERPTLILKALEGFINQDFVEVDLAEFEERFKELHYPFNETIKVLCRSCHTEYDKKTSRNSKPEFRIEKTQSEKEENKVLPIRLNPEDKNLFKERILESKKAKIQIEYNNGDFVTVDWDASKLDNESNIFGNLRSRTDFRQGNWQKKDIKEVLVTVSA